MEQNNLVGQKVIWGRVPAKRPGIFIDSTEGEFIEWEELKKEIEEKLLPLVSHLPTGCTAITKTHDGKEHLLVRAVYEGKDVGAVWFGGNPYKDWESDGLVRVGCTEKEGAPKTIVWLVTQRMSDGSYEVLESYNRDGTAM